MARTKKDAAESTRMMRPAATQEAREAQLIALAQDEVEYRIRNHTASGQELTALLKLGSAKANLEREKIRHETEVLKAKKEVLEASKRTDEMYEKALTAMRKYNGIEETIDDPYILGID